jgi:hypothetical protein
MRRSLSSACFGSGPHFFGAPARPHPLCACCRQCVRCDEYEPSRRSRPAHLPVPLQTSACRRMRCLYSAVNAASPVLSLRSTTFQAVEDVTHVSQPRWHSGKCLKRMCYAQWKRRGFMIGSGVVRRHAQRWLLSARSSANALEPHGAQAILTMRGGTKVIVSMQLERSSPIRMSTTSASSQYRRHHAEARKKPRRPRRHDENCTESAPHPGSCDKNAEMWRVASAISPLKIPQDRMEAPRSRHGAQNLR